MTDGPVFPQAAGDPVVGSDRSLPTAEESESLPPAIRGILGLAVLIAGGIAALPWLASQTTLGDRIAAVVAAKLPPGTTIGRPTLSWLQPAGVQDVRYERPGLTVDVATVRIDRPFWSVLTGKQTPDTVTAEGVRVAIDLDRSDRKTDGGGDARSGPSEGLPKLPNLRVTNLTVEVTGGGLLRPVTLQSPATTWSAIDGGYDFAAAVAVLVAPERRIDGTASSAGTVELAGTVQYSGDVAVDAKSAAFDLNRLQAATSSPLPAGPFAFEVDARRVQDALSGRIGLTAKRLTYAAGTNPKPVPVDNVRTIVRFSADPSASIVKLEQLRLQSDQLSASAVGEWDRSDRPDASRLIEANVNVAGSLLTALGLPDDFRVTQAQLQNVTIRDSIAGPVATGDLTWPLLAAYGLVSQNGRVAWTAAADQGSVVMTQVPIGTGFVRGRYDVDWSDDPTVRFAGGPMLERVVLTESLCRDWIRYVSPALANGTEVDGEFSLAMAPFEMPASGRPKSFEGALRIERASLRPGPLLGNLAGQVQAVRLATGRENRRRLPEELVQVPRQTVRFVGDPTGVRHDRFELRMREVAITTEAAVGYDQSLAGELTIIPPPRASTDRPVLAGLASGPLTFAIGGTVSKPQLQRGTVRDVGRQLLQNGGRQLLQNLLDR